MAKSMRWSVSRIRDGDWRLLMTSTSQMPALMVSGDEYIVDVTEPNARLYFRRDTPDV